MGLFDFIQKEWATVSAAPRIFGSTIALCLTAGLASGYWAGSTLYLERIGVLNETIRQKEGEIGELYKRLDERITDIEKRLSAEQVSELQGALGKAPGTVKIGGDSPYALQLKGVFSNSGWEVVPLSEFESKEPVIHADDQAALDTIIRAFDDAGVEFQTLDAHSKVREPEQLIVPAPLPQPQMTDPAVQPYSTMDLQTPPTSDLSPSFADQ